MWFMHDVTSIHFQHLYMSAISLNLNPLDFSHMKLFKKFIIRYNNEDDLRIRIIKKYVITYNILYITY